MEPAEGLHRAGDGVAALALDCDVDGERQAGAGAVPGTREPGGDRLEIERGNVMAVNEEPLGAGQADAAAGAGHDHGFFGHG